jgi:S-formylglutathione hydrolase FrmB
MNKFTRAVLFIALALSLTQAQTANVRSSAVSGNQANAKTANTRVQMIPFASKMVGRVLPYNVLLPLDYEEPAARGKRYPVLYLLHGLFGHYDNWMTNTKLSDYAAKYSMIIIMPEGNDNWYTDSETSPADKYETYIVQELIPDVQRRYRTIEAREGRAITGLSMGGYGALKFGVKHPEMFVFVGSMSGALRAASWAETDLRGLEAIWRTLAPVYGPENSPVRAANDVFKLIRELTSSQVAALPYVYLDCGTEDPFLSSSRSMSEILLAHKIPHEYRELPGTHSWTYWDSQVEGVLAIAARKMRGPALTMASRNKNED